MTMSHTTVIHWFRKGLRIHDNPALLDAIDIIKNNHKGEIYLRPIFVLDPGIVKWMKVGPNRWRFLQESLAQLNENLLKINSKLYVVRGNPNEVFPRLFKEWHVTHLTFEADIEPYAVKRDKIVEEQAIAHNVKVRQQVSHTVFDPNLIITKNQGLPPLTYQKFNSLISTCKVSPPLPTPKVLTFQQPIKDTWEIKDPKCYDVPALSDLTNESLLGANLFPGGETEGLTRMETYLKKTNWICTFEKPNTAPNSLEPSTTVLSPYLKFGCLSSRLFYIKLLDILSKHKKHSQPPVSLLGQLIWREFYYCVASVTPNFDKMVGNTVCLQVPWDKNEKFLHAWTHGLTGYPFIDAIMRQLRQEGWIHHLARHAVACFLTRGDLWISWEEGQRVFEEFLLDADWALNAGNWMWLSASAFFHQYFRVYSPVAFGKKTDPQGIYIKKYVPELKKYPSGLIYEPWKATVKIQKELGCIIGKDYPTRIVVHEDVYKENINRMTKAYKIRRDQKEQDSNKSVTNLANSSSSNIANKRKPTKNSNEISPITKYFKKK